MTEGEEKDQRERGRGLEWAALAGHALKTWGSWGNSAPASFSSRMIYQ